MPIPRCKLIDPSRLTWVHCISRCVRQAWLCGHQVEHRKSWVTERLQFLARCFAVEVASFAVMSNHLHLIARMRPDGTGEWSAEQVAERWMSIYPRQYLSDGTPVLPSRAVVEAQARDWSWVAERRKRLADLGWFMKALKEHIARLANREEGRTGHFWAGRFASVSLLDQAALVACMAYIDLNPVRAEVCDRPEHADHTAGQQRIRARQRFRAAQHLRMRAPERADRLLTRAGLAPIASHAEDGLWLAPLSQCMVGEVLGNRRWSVDDYLALLDATGRMVRAGKRGAIPPRLPPLLQRLDLGVEEWMATMLGRRQMNGRAIGGAASRAAEATRRGLRWVKNRCLLFVERSTAA